MTAFHCKQNHLSQADALQQALKALQYIITFYFLFRITVLLVEMSLAKQ